MNATAPPMDFTHPTRFSHSDRSGNPYHASSFDPSRPHLPGDTPTHPALIGYLFWVIGFTGAHRFYFGRPWTGALWFFTGGLFLIGWIVDVFLIPSMAESANGRFAPSPVDYSTAWVLAIFLGVFGVHRFFMGKIVTGAIFLVTGGLFGIGWAYDLCTLNTQIEELADGLPRAW